MNERWTVHHGDALAVLRTMPDASFDAMLTDPPAGIAFMNRDWDRDKGGRTAWIAWLAEIMREALRCMKPGAHGLVWALPRTQHWTATALEDAGFEVRDVICHVFASGFPKSLNISKAIDATAGVERDVIGPNPNSRPNMVRVSAAVLSPRVDAPITAPATDLAKRWDGYGTALKPAMETWILIRKPLDGTVVANVTKHGVGGLAIDACRIGTDEDLNGGAYSGSDKRRDPRPDSAPGARLLRRLANGRWPANLVLSHDPKCAEDACVDGCPVKLLDEQSGDRPGMSGGGNHRADYAGGMFGVIDCAHTARGDNGGASRFFATFRPDPEPFRYCPKPSTSEREFGCDDLPKRSAGEMTGGREDESAAMDSPRTGAGRGDGARNFHPTIKAVALTKYFATLLLPPARGAPRRILTPFAGSGSEMIGALRAGWEESVGIEQDADFVTIASARLARWEQVAPHLDEAEAVASATEPDERQPSLFDGVGT